MGFGVVIKIYNSRLVGAERTLPEDSIVHWWERRTVPERQVTHTHTQMPSMLLAHKVFVMLRTREKARHGGKNNRRLSITESGPP